MSEGTTLTVRLPATTKARLARLAGRTNREPSVLGAAAIADYVDRELAIVEAIERGQEAVRAGRYVSTEEAFRQVDEVIAAALVKA